MKKTNNVTVILALALLSVFGCSRTERPLSLQPVAVIDSRPPVRITAVGYGTESNFVDYNAGQKKIMAIRAAKVDAYRSLAEQVHGFHVSGHTSIAAAVAQNDSARMYVDAFVRGAKLLEITPMVNASYEATVELVLTAKFLDCLSAQYGPDCPVANPPSYQPGYVTNGSALY